MTAATTTATATAAATSQQLSHLARALDHHAQGPNIPFGVNPSLRQMGEEDDMLPGPSDLILVQKLLAYSHLQPTCVK